MTWWTGDEWRWHLESSSSSRSTIAVIEPGEEPNRRDGPRVPFGFARVLAQPVIETEPLLWEGDGA